ncbi:MAG: Uncharacterised protein [Hyphomonas sp. TMED17]|nr:MAG: Uncharacterised protein [Hyphomonas sp. TMED17]
MRWLILVTGHRTLTRCGRHWWRMVVPLRSEPWRRPRCFGRCRKPIWLMLYRAWPSWKKTLTGWKRRFHIILRRSRSIREKTFRATGPGRKPRSLRAILILDTCAVIQMHLKPPLLIVTGLLVAMHLPICRPRKHGCRVSRVMRWLVLDGSMRRLMFSAQRAAGRAMTMPAMTGSCRPIISPPACSNLDAMMRRSRHSGRLYWRCRMTTRD